MLDMNNLRKEKFEGVTKILDYVLVVLFAAFFILSLFPYFSVEAKGEIAATVGGETYSVEAKVADSCSLLGYVGFPYNHSSCEKWQAEMYKENKSTVKENEENGYKGFFKGTLGKMGVQFANKKGEKNPYQELDVPGITTKTVSIKQVGSILFLDLFALVGIAILLLTKGTPRALYSVVWGIFAVLAFHYSYLLNMGTNAIKPIMLVVSIITLVVAVVASVLYIIDGRSRAAYLRSISAAYA